MDSTNVGERLLRAQDVYQMTGLKRSAILLRVERGEFPKPLWLSSTCRAWRLSDIQGWIDQRQDVQPSARGRA